MNGKKGSSLSVGAFLAISDIKRSNPWTTTLIIFVMTLTFFNMLLLGGILIGVAEGRFGSFRAYYSSDVFITPATNKAIIEQTGTIVGVVKSLPEVDGISVRYTSSGTLEYGYQTKVRTSDKSESAGGTLTGINPEDENSVSKMSSKVIAGSFLTSEDSDAVVIGSSLTSRYATTAPGASVSDNVLKHADVGSRVKLLVNSAEKEVIIKGIVSTGNTVMDGRIYITDTVFRNLVDNTSVDADEIAIKLKPNVSAESAKKYIATSLNNNPDINIKTYTEAIPSSSADIITTFRLLSDVVGAVSLIVGAITIFIVIYVNAITRRKYIGILKGIGISATAIKASYIYQALFYALAGIAVSSILLLGYLIPYFIIHPIVLPLGKSSLAITTSDIVTRAIILSITAFISGYIPAWLVVRQNTLDAILGR